MKWMSKPTAARYEADRARDIALAGAHGIDEAMQSNRLDALLFPGSSGAAVGARPGYPSIAVPFAMVPNAGVFPGGFDPKPGPFGVTFTAMACGEARLIELGYAFEQATKRRVAPPLP
jgi:amidase